MARLDQPTHLYVKRHIRTGLKYFGRTVKDPQSYRGSGAYWTSHLERYGNHVVTTVVGTFTDSEELREAAEDFSEEHDIEWSTDWANLLGEDGGTSGEGWRVGLDYTDKIRRLDEAVAARMRAPFTPFPEDEPLRVAASPAPERGTSRPITPEPERSYTWVWVVLVVLGLVWVGNQFWAEPTPAPTARPTVTCDDLFEQMVADQRGTRRLSDELEGEIMEALTGNCPYHAEVLIDWSAIRRHNDRPCSLYEEFGKTNKEAIAMARQEGACS